MCLAPSKISDGQFVACRGCDICRQNRVNDLIGRCIAEQSTATKTVAVTLTYAGDGPESAVLRYADVQKFLKLLRAKRGGNYKVRYICAGEYGTKKGRAHWHLVLFFYGDAPNVSLETRFNWKYWPHGFVYFQQPDYKGFKYVMKYALKQMDQDGYSKALSMSKKPPLGYAFLMNLADDMAEKGLALHSPEYAFAHVLAQDGRAKRYWLQGRMREKFLDRYYIMYRMLHRCDPPWSDFFVEKYLDPIEKLRREDDPTIFERDRAIRQDEFDALLRARSSADFKAAQAVRHSVGLLCFPGSDALLECFSDRTATFYLGDDKWHLTASSVTVAEQLLRGGVPLNLSLQSQSWLNAKWQVSLPLSESRQKSWTA